MSRLKSTGGCKKYLPPFGDKSFSRSLHAKEPVLMDQFTVSWCSASYKGSELTFKETALLCSY